MPPSVRIAILTSCVFTALGLAAAVVWVVDVLWDGSGTRWLSAALGAPDGSVRMLFSPIYLQGIVVVFAAVRRDGRARELAFQLTLLFALLYGFLGAAVAIAAALQRRVDVATVAGLLVFALAALQAWSLARPSAKAWFSADRPGA